MEDLLNRFTGLKPDTEVSEVQEYRKSSLISDYGKLCFCNMLDKCKKAAGEREFV